MDQRLEPAKHQYFAKAVSRIGQGVGAFLRRMESSSRANQDVQRLLVSEVKDYAILMLDPNGHIKSWNVGAAQIKGYRADEIIGKHFSIFYESEAIAARLPWRMLEVAQLNGRCEDEGWRVRKDGSKFFANVVVTPLYDNRGRLCGFTKITRDITNQHRSAEEFRKIREQLEKLVEERSDENRRQSKRLRDITDSLPGMISEFDAEVRFRFLNDACRQWLNVEDSQLIGCAMKSVIDAPAYEQLKPFIDSALTGNKVTFERETSKDGKRFFYAVNYIPEFDEVGRPNGFIAVANDVTKHKEAIEAAEAANQAKSSFLANMSHEIRTPLGAVLGFSELLLNPNLNETDRYHYFSVIKRNGELLSSIINDILDLSKVEAGKLEIERRSVPLKDVLSDTTSILSLQAQEKGLRLHTVSEIALPSAIETDAQRLRQILINVVGNAIKFTQKGDVELRIRILSNGTERPMLAFDVRDTGPGISPDKVGILFEPFMQADISTKRKFGGTGLGLVLSKRLANLLGGDLVLAESVVGKGSVFTITIDPGPMSISSPDQTELVRRNQTGIGSNISLNGLKVLLVEDAPDNQVLVGHYLKGAGAIVDTANNGKEAIEMVGLHRYDILLMDLQMPIMDGYEATSTLRKGGYRLPIIALTAHALKEERRRCLDSGFDDHVSKPIDRSLLLDVIRQRCNQQLVDSNS